MILVASVGVGFGLFRAVPVLGTAVLLVVPPALIRTMTAASQRAGDGRPMSRDERLSTFFRSIGLMLGVIVASLLAFVIVFMPAGSMAMGTGNRGLSIALGVAVAAGGGVAWLLLRRGWPYKG